MQGIIRDNWDATRMFRYYRKIQYIKMIASHHVMPIVKMKPLTIEWLSCFLRNQDGCMWHWKVGQGQCWLKSIQYFVLMHQSSCFDASEFLFWCIRDILKQHQHGWLWPWSVGECHWWLSPSLCQIKFYFVCYPLSLLLWLLIVFHCW